MSMDLSVFHTVRPISDAEALERYISYCENELRPEYVEPSPKVEALLRELAETYPQIDDIPESQLDQCPWSCAHDVSESHAIMAMVSSKYESAAMLIVELAHKYGLVCFDPISGTILTAPEGIHVVKKRPWWRFWQ